MLPYKDSISKMIKMLAIDNVSISDKCQISILIFYRYTHGNIRGGY